METDATGDRVGLAVIRGLLAADVTGPLVGPWPWPRFGADSIVSSTVISRSPSRPVRPTPRWHAGSAVPGKPSGSASPAAGKNGDRRGRARPSELDRRLPPTAATARCAAPQVEAGHTPATRSETMQPPPLPLPPARKPETTPIDLREAFVANGGFLNRSLPASPPWRPLVRLEPGLPARDVRNVAPLQIAAAVDGIQASLVFTVTVGRPSFLVYVAAGAVGPTHRLARVAERLVVLASLRDARRLQATTGDLPVVALDALSSPALAWHHAAVVPDWRQQLEWEIVTACAADGRFVLVDGSIDRYVGIPGLIGCVKKPEAAYAVDEAELYQLPVGHRSDAFRVEPHTTVEQRWYGAYLRLHPPFAFHTFGLVVVQTTDPELLDAAAAACFAQRQKIGNGDPRADRHLLPIRRCEEALRARRPPHFSAR